jgi:hypothetical protein
MDLSEHSYPIISNFQGLSNYNVDDIDSFITEYKEKGYKSLLIESGSEKVLADLLEISDQIEEIILRNIIWDDWSILNKFGNLKFLSLQGSFFPKKRFNIVDLPQLINYNGAYTPQFIDIKDSKCVVFRVGCSMNFSKTIDEYNFPNTTKYLSLSGTKVKSLKGIENLQNLEALILYFSDSLKDIEPILELKKLRKIHVIKCPKVNIAPIMEMKQLEEINIYGPRKLKSLKFINNMPHLHTLCLNCSKIEDEDLSPLVGRFWKCLFWKNKGRLDFRAEDISKI